MPGLWGGKLKKKQIPPSEEKQLQDRVIKALRKAWLWSPVRRACLKAALTGSKNEVGEATSLCNECGNEVVKVYADHIQPVVPVAGFDSWDELVRRFFAAGNHQALCKRCHDDKSKKENAGRKKKIR